ncbi:MAG: DNA replication/repair protein RecF [Flavobacteriales bacterium]|jgi:DNA replication and repair protein RecF|nr:DNA replication/repair protein RecF [Flavobacteriales bacterium]
MSFELTRLRLLNFRNHAEVAMDPGPQVNCITGPNGVGKTNLLDAIHYLALGKSYFEPTDQHNILHGADMFMVQGSFRTAAGDDEVLCSVRRGQRKLMSRNRKEYARLADHVGRYPVVMITPYDTVLVGGGSEVRRRFLDGLIAQFDKGYLEHLIRYNRVLLQRNTLLKRFAEQGGGSLGALEPWDMQLAELATAVHGARLALMERLTPLLNARYHAIGTGPEEVALEYRSTLTETPMRRLLADAWDRDRSAQHTTVGIHKDDLEFTINGHPLKRFGSQGQQKTYLIALKLAQFGLTREHTGLRPILLLDDIFDKIDPQRMRQLLRMLGDGQFGQVFITDTDAPRLLAALEGLGLDVRSLPIDHRTTDHEEAERTIAQ